MSFMERGSPKWRKAVLDFDPFSGDFGEPGERRLRDQIVVARKPVDCHGCGHQCVGGRTPMLKRVIVIVSPGEGLKHFDFCALCCDAQARSWTDQGEALTARRMARTED